MSHHLDRLSNLLSLQQRVARYRELAQNALIKAAEADNGDLKAGFLSMASGWHGLAAEAERLAWRHTTAGDFLAGSAEAAD